MRPEHNVQCGIGDINYGSLYYSKLREKRYSGQASILLPFSLLYQNYHFKAGCLIMLFSIQSRLPTVNCIYIPLQVGRGWVEPLHH